MSSTGNLFFTLTHREADALRTLDRCPIAWRTFTERTWSALVAKGLVRDNGQGRPVPTPAGMAAITLTRALNHVNAHIQGAAKTGTGADAAARPENPAPVTSPGATAVT